MEKEKFKRYVTFWTVSDFSAMRIKYFTAVSTTRVHTGSVRRGKIFQYHTSYRQSWAHTTLVATIWQRFNEQQKFSAASQGTTFFTCRSRRAAVYPGAGNVGSQTAGEPVPNVVVYSSLQDIINSLLAPNLTSQIRMFLNVQETTNCHLKLKKKRNR